VAKGKALGAKVEVYSVSSHEAVEEQVSVPVRGFKVVIYGFCGCLVGVSSIVLASRISRTIAERGPGMPLVHSSGGTGCLATWQWVHSSASVALKGSEPVTIS
jgi:ABC-type xylose transport system permease subunit